MAFTPFGGFSYKKGYIAGTPIKKKRKLRQSFIGDVLPSKEPEPTPKRIEPIKPGELEKKEREKRLGYAGGLSPKERLELAQARAKPGEEPTGIDPKTGEYIYSPEIMAAAKKEEWKREAEPGLKEEFEEAGVFREPELVPIVPPEMENLGVIMDIIKSVIPAPIKSAIALGLADPGKLTEMMKGREPTQADITMQTNSMINLEQTAAGIMIDDKIEAEETKLTEMGFGVSAVIGVVAAGTIGGAIGAPIAQAVGSDKTVKNLEMAITNLDKVHSEILKGVNSGALTPGAAFEKCNRIERIINTVESQIKEAAITSPNVRISLRGREIAIRILSSREKLFGTRGEIAVAIIQRRGKMEDPAEIGAYLLSLKS